MVGMEWNELTPSYPMLKWLRFYSILALCEFVSLERGIGFLWRLLYATHKTIGCTKFDNRSRLKLKSTTSVCEM